MPLIAHYTDAAGLLGVLSGRAIWFSDARRLNDSAEILAGEALLRQELTQRAATSQDEIEKTQLLGMLQEMEATFRQSVPLVASFSKAIDSLAQWRGYGRHRVGACLCFDREELQTYLDQMLPNRPVRLLDCLYGEDEQKRLVSDVVDDALREWRASPIFPRNTEIGQWARVGYRRHLFPNLDKAMEEATLPPEQRSEFAQRTLKEWHDRSTSEPPFTDFAWRLQAVLPSVKHPSFAAEQEVRALYVAHKADVLKFRHNDRLLIPYLPIEVLPKGHNEADKDAGSGPLKEVIVGPGPDQDRIADAVQMVLFSNDYWHVKVSKSACTYVP